MKTTRIALGILSLCALSACGSTDAPLSPEQAKPRYSGGIWTIGVGAHEPPPSTTAAADTTERAGIWTIGVGRVE